MTFFRKNRWGPSSPNDYKKLNSMAQNDLAIKEIIDKAAKGVIMWNTADSLTITKPKVEGTPPSPNLDQSWRPMPNYQDLEFPVGKDRFINFVFHPGIMSIKNTDPPASIIAGTPLEAEMRIIFALDGVNVSSAYLGSSPIYMGIYGPADWDRSNRPLAFTTYSPTFSSDLSEGVHKLSVMFKLYDEGNYGLEVRLDRSFLYVEDLGRREI